MNYLSGLRHLRNHSAGYPISNGPYSLAEWFAHSVLVEHAVDYYYYLCVCARARLFGTNFFFRYLLNLLAPISLLAKAQFPGYPIGFGLVPSWFRGSIGGELNRSTVLCSTW